MIVTWRQAVAGAGLVAAFLGAFLDWATARGFGVGPLDSNARFRIGDWLGTDTVDGYLVVLLAAGGLAALVLARMARVAVRWRTLVESAPGMCGAVLAAIGAANLQYITGDLEGVDPGFGLYLVMAGGIAAASARLLPDSPIGRRSRA